MYELFVKERHISRKHGEGLSPYITRSENALGNALAYFI